MCNKQNRRRGFSLVEVLILVAVLGIVGAAAGRALQAAAKMPVTTENNLEIETALITKMESIRALAFANIAVGAPNATLSDTVTIGGTSYARTVTVALADANGDGNAESTFKTITVTCNGMTVTTQVSN
jgi:prepilin-type N-terminal cleavage/methylation domain-containing protein